MTGGEYINSCFKENARTFSKNSTTQEKIRMSRLKKKSIKLLRKKQCKPEIKPMIENLQHELYQLQNNQAKDAKLCGNIRWELECEK